MLEPPRDALKERPKGGREEKARGADAELECERDPEIDAPGVRGRALDDPPVRGRDGELEYDRLAPPLLLNVFFGSIYCSKSLYLQA